MQHTRIVVTHYGGPDTIQVVEEECPGPKRGEACLIRSLFVEVEDPIAACEAPHIHLG